MQAEVSLENKDPFIYQYPTTCGTLSFRTAVSEFMERHLGVKIGQQNIIPTFGNSIALSTIARTLAKPNDLVIVEEYTYYLAGGLILSAVVACHSCIC